MTDVVRAPCKYSLLIHQYHSPELEWMLSRTGGFKTDLECDPRGPRVKDVMMGSLRGGGGSDSDNESDDNDW